MAPTDEMSNDQRLEDHSKRLDEHGTRLASLDGRLTLHASRVERHEQILVGDDQLGLTGLVTQLRQISGKLDDIGQWKAELDGYGRFAMTVVKVVVGLLGMIGFGVWWPELVGFYHWLIGA